jgi:hypothetical protein
VLSFFELNCRGSYQGISTLEGVQPGFVILQDNKSSYNDKREE